jgi:hypothetical protein
VHIRYQLISAPAQVRIAAGFDSRASAFTARNTQNPDFTMSYNELFHLFDGFFLLLGITVMLLHIFILRFRRNRDLLAVTGVIGTPLLILMILWIVWGRYSLSHATLQAVLQKDPAVRIVSFDKRVLKKPAIYKTRNIRYIIDQEATTNEFYLPWRLVPVRTDNEQK